MVQDFDGNFVIAGIADDSNGFDRKQCAYLLKTDQEGNEIWARTYPHSEHSAWIEEVKQTTDSGYILVGGIGILKGLGVLNAYVIRTDKKGDIKWSKLIGGESNENLATCIFEDSMRNFVIGGYTCSFGESANGSQTDFYIIKIDDRGNTLWTKAYEQKGGNEECYSVQKHNDGGYLLVGHRNEYLYVLKVDENGDSLWSRKFGNENTSQCGRSMVKTADGGFSIFIWIPLQGASRLWLFTTPNNSFRDWLIETKPDEPHNPDKFGC